MIHVVLLRKMLLVLNTYIIHIFFKAVIQVVTACSHSCRHAKSSQPKYAEEDIRRLIVVWLLGKATETIKDEFRCF